uniref:Uncharacterized protein n=1 Tax=Moniliophthora roreri TaxID=221103 RepID=A0A0W0FX48_MONRR
MPLPDTFNPLATHPFNNFTPALPSPSHTAYGNLSSPSPSRPPYAAKLAPPGTPGIFIPFRQDAASPELSDILRKKASSSASSSSSSTPKSTPSPAKSPCDI